MTRPESHPRHPHTPAPWCDVLAQRLLVGLLAFMPLAFGAVEAWSELVVWVVCFGLVCCLGVRAWKWKTTGGLRWTPAYIPLALFVLLVLLQALPVPFLLIEWLSPHAAGLYQTLRQDILGSFTLSLYARSTWHDLCLVMAASAIFLTVVNVFRHTAQIKQLLLAVSLIGIALALLALLQGMFGNGYIYWIGPAEVQLGSGTFACHNHLSQHLNLSVMAMLAYAMIRMRETLGRDWTDRDSLTDVMGNPELRLARWMIVFAIIGLIAVAMSVSRMGIVSSAVAIIFLTLLFAVRQGRQRSAVPLLVGVAAVSAVILVGFELVFERMATLQNLASYDKRWTVVTDLLPAFGHFIIAGSGLGTFSAVYPLYDTGTVTQFASHAENEYAQLLLEMGLAGSAMLIWFLSIIVASAVRAIKRMDAPILVAAPALAAGLLAVAIHSWTDFGQHLPAIAGLSAVFCGLLVVLGQRATTRPAAAAHAVSKTAQPRFTAALLGLLGLLLLLNVPAAWWRVFAEQSDAAARESAAQLEKTGWKTPDTEAYSRLIAQGEAAVSLDPGNALYRYRLGVYRRRCVVRGRTKEEVGLATPPEFRDVAEQIVTEMIIASSACPTMGAIHCWRGQMEWWVLGREEGRQRIEAGMRTSGNDPIAWCAAGQLAVVEGNVELALTRFRRALELRGGMLAQAFEVIVQDAHRPDLAVGLAGDDPQRLYDVSGMLLQRGFTPEGEQARKQAVLAYRHRLTDATTPAWAFAMLADASSRDGLHQDAAALYQRALAKEYAQLAWRMALARELLACGRIDDAQREAEVCRRVKPDSRPVADLLIDISTARWNGAATQPSASKAKT